MGMQGPIVVFEPSVDDGWKLRHCEDLNALGQKGKRVIAVQDHTKKHGVRTVFCTFSGAFCTKLGAPTRIFTVAATFDRVRIQTFKSMDDRFFFDEHVGPRAVDQFR